MISKHINMSHPRLYPSIGSLVVAGIRTPDLVYIMHCPYQS